ncbi:MAG TPA: type II toxin-antitoxin system VapC family toxin [Vicinamibacterales bacterium]|jgi:predicted nucleic acid-binding protein|nr:type II toxin-antitoxin system VapC family toxin [Vicinamibacterales bacterium]
MYLLDTNVVSELRRPDKADARVFGWAAASPVADFFLSAISVLELELGVLMLERRDPAQGLVLRAWLDGQILPQFEGRILPVDTAVALQCAGLYVPDPRSHRDAMIAATALVHKMTVATRNVSDFAPTGVRTFNPWTEG